MAKKQRILIVEDDQSLADLLVEELNAAEYETAQVPSAEAALSWIDTWTPTLVISDLSLPGANGMSLLSQIKDKSLSPLFLIITAFGTINQAVDALKAGADDFLTKPLDMDHLLLTIKSLLEKQQLRDTVEHYRKIVDKKFHGIIGQSQEMRNLYDQIQQIGSTNGPVIILGESGVGKELIAKAVHAESTRVEGPFIAVNCASIPSELLESEFFGHAAGAFTGAKQARPGLLVQATGGTLLLDEIAEMPLALQAKLLRALQNGWVRPVGKDREVQVDVRIIAATHQNLQEKIEEGSFRKDLYYRLETFALHVPPLRERGDDILLLANHFLNELIQDRETVIQGFNHQALMAIRNYSYPGNVRELQNAIEYAVTFCHDQYIDVTNLPKRFYEKGTKQAVADYQPDPAQTLQKKTDLESLESIQRNYVTYVLNKVHGNKLQAAKILGVTRRTLYRWLSKDENES